MSLLAIPRPSRRMVAGVGAAALASMLVVGCSDGDGGSADTAAGDALFDSSCAACHGPDASGVAGLGPDLHDNAWIQEHSDDEVYTLLREGRLAGAPDNQTGVSMPPKGGNPSLSEQDLHTIVDYLRSLQ